jgi:hypothetical protein
LAATGNGGGIEVVVVVDELVVLTAVVVVVIGAELDCEIDGPDQFAHLMSTLTPLAQ